jgi:hypothetical protein
MSCSKTEFAIGESTGSFLAAADDVSGFKPETVRQQSVSHAENMSNGHPVPTRVRTRKFHSTRTAD